MTSDAPVTHRSAIDLADASVLAASAAFEAERPWPQPYDVAGQVDSE